MIYLYLKTHKNTGLKYLGMTIKDPFKYRGSGIYWVKHIKKYGNNVDTEILSICNTNAEIKELGSYYSELWDIVNSPQFANLVPESGNDSSGMLNKFHSKESKEKTRQSLLGHKVSDETKYKIRTTRENNHIEPWNKGKYQEYTMFDEEYKKELSIKYTGENNPFYGKQHTDDFKNTQRETQKLQIKCPYCDKMGAMRIMKRWHFDNCKHKILENI